MPTTTFGYSLLGQIRSDGGSRRWSSSGTCSSFLSWWRSGWLC
jgi:hypothetical protein